MKQDEEHLRLVSIFHYVVGGLTALAACFPFLHLAVGIALVSGAFPVPQGQQGPPPIVGWIFIATASVLILGGWTMAVAIVLAGRFLNRRVHYMYCLVVAAVECLFMPLGTILGVFTIIVLIRPSVKAFFEPTNP